LLLCEDIAGDAIVDAGRLIARRICYQIPGTSTV
jgi:hypothetical protein